MDEVHGRHLGSTSLLEVIERKRPPRVVCGHIHQRWGGEALIGITPMSNVSPEGGLPPGRSFPRAWRRGQ